MALIYLTSFPLLESQPVASVPHTVAMENAELELKEVTEQELQEAYEYFGIAKDEALDSAFEIASKHWKKYSTYYQ